MALGLLAFALGLLATPSLRQALFGGDQWSLTVEGGLGSVDPNYVSFVVDPASLEVVPKYPRYPYPVDFPSPALKALVKELAPALFVITGGNSNCISYADGFDPGSSPKSSADNYLSSYCEGKTYYGNLSSRCPRRRSPSSSWRGSRTASAGAKTRRDHISKQDYLVYD